MTSASTPFPSKADLLNRLKQLEIPITEVIDVGVRECTTDLISAFPTRKHHLFEPVSLFFPKIEKNYAAVNHVLYEMALSDSNQRKFLVVTSLNKDGTATRSSIRDVSETVDGWTVISCCELEVRRFDSLDATFAGNALLKIDVDGADLRVLQGFGQRLSRARGVVRIRAARQRPAEATPLPNALKAFEVAQLALEAVLDAAEELLEKRA